MMPNPNQTINGNYATIKEIIGFLDFPIINAERVMVGNDEIATKADIRIATERAEKAEAEVKRLESGLEYMAGCLERAHAERNKWFTRAEATGGRLVEMTERAEKAEREVKSLRSWKESNLIQWQNIRLHEVGKALDVQLGCSITLSILPGILELKEERDAALAKAAKLEDLIERAVAASHERRKAYSERYASTPKDSPK